MHESDMEHSLVRLESQLNIYRSLEQYVSDCGEAYPGETATIQKNIRCLSRVILLSRGESVASSVPWC